MPLKDIKGLGTTVVVLLAIQIVFLAAEAVTLVRRINLLSQIRSGSYSLTGQVSGADAAVNTTEAIVSVVFVTTVVFWCVWQHHAQYNAIRFATGPLQFTPGWAVGWWFIPIANLWKPFQTVRELWKASHGGDAWRTLATWSLIGWWWAIWLASNVHFWAGSSGGGMSFGTAPTGSPVTPTDVINRDAWELFSTALTVVAALLAIKLVRTITDLQQRASQTWLPSAPPALFGAALPPPPPPPPV
jgi:Domain of unknown function (DUF4328)